MTDSLKSARWAISAIFFVFGALIGGWLPHIPDVKQLLGIPNATLGFALLSSGIGATLVLPGTGFLVHRYGSRNVALVAGLVAAALVPGLALERSVTGLCLNLFLIGLGYGCMDVSMNAHAVEIQARHDRPMLSAVHGFFSIGGFAGSAGAALAAKMQISPVVHMGLNSLLLACLLVVAGRFLLPAEVDKEGSGPRFVFPTGILLLIGGLCMCATVLEGAVLDWTALLLRSGLGASAELGAIGTATVNFAMAAGRFGGDRAIHAAGYRTVLVVSGIVSAIGVLAGVAVHSPYMAILGLSLSGLGTANMIPILFAKGGTVKGFSAGTGLAAVTTCAYAGFLIGPPALGYVADARSLAFAMGLLSGPAILIAGLARFVVRKDESGSGDYGDSPARL
jgi:fucose permease